MFDTLSYKKTIKFDDGDDELKGKLKSDFQNAIISKEQNLYKRVKSIWDHKGLNVSQDKVSFSEINLFSKESEEYFGLSKKELITYSATLGAAVGASVDFAFLGHTMLLGALVGGIGGAIAGSIGFDKLADIKVLVKDLE